MIIAFLCGGLGNQMFQYAAARRLAQFRQAELKLDLSEYRGGMDQRPAGLQAFRRRVGVYDLAITAKEASPEEIAQLKDPFADRSATSRIVRQLRRLKPGLLQPASDVGEKSYRFDPAVLELSGDVYLHGFWQSEKYFTDVASLIRREFTAKNPAIGKYACDYVATLRHSNGPIVSLHVRRGDLAVAFESPHLRHTVHGKPVSIEYIKSAIARFSSDHRFLVFSDSANDIQWCRQNLRGEGIPQDRLLYSDGHSDIQDMAIMSACDHHVIANSSFSWWAAWLNPSPGKRVIAPSVWSPAGTANAIVTDDLIPADWEMV
jgi:hypothetical protein